MQSRYMAVLSVLAALACAPAANAAVTPFSDTYKGHHLDGAVSSCRTPLPLTGLEPSGPGHPVLVHLVGAGEPHDGAEAPAILRAAAAKGFVAASVAYPQWQFHAKGIDGSSRCIFDSWSPASAIARLCGRPTANCYKGVVVSGFSQGGVIALRAANHDWRVRGAYLLGVAEERSGWEGTSRWTQATTWPVGTRALPNRSIRIVNGITDAPPSSRDELNEMTGRSCAVTAVSCLAADGSGWYVVQHSQVATRMADHCYFMGGTGWSSCTPDPPFDRTWLTSTTAPWALRPNLEWLRRRTG